MIEQMMKTLVPLLIRKIGEISEEDKLNSASFLNSLSSDYLDNDKDRFTYSLSQTSLPEDWQASLVDALWPNENQS